MIIAPPAVDATGVARPAARKSRSAGRPRWPIGRLGALSALALAVHGYHLGADDSAIYVPGIKQTADPSLYPFGSEFFLNHARLTLFPDLIGGTARLAHVPVDAAILAWHFIGILLLLAAGWQLLGLCFSGRAARWCGVTLLAGALSVPVAGTGLAIVDPYLASRSLSTPMTLFAVAAWLSGRRRLAMLWIALAAAIHPQMAVYAVGLLACITALRYTVRVRLREPVIGLAAALPFALDFAPVTGAARACLLSRTFFFVSTWAWYEWLGVIAPLLLLAWWRKAPPRNTRPGFQEVAGALIPFGIASTALALLLDIVPSLESYNRLQPMRSFHLIYVIFFLLLGGLIGEYVLRSRPARWAALFIPLAAGMLCLSLVSYPASPHIELPGSAGSNPWLRAFFWVRTHTPKDAVFALDPEYMSQPGEDAHGFRAIAERSVLADALKDSGAVSLFPRLADDWSRQVTATRGLSSFQPADFRRLEQQFPVTWIVTTHASPSLACPYRDGAVAVCRL